LQQSCYTNNRLREGPVCSNPATPIIGASLQQSCYTLIGASLHVECLRWQHTASCLTFDMSVVLPHKDVYLKHLSGGGSPNPIQMNRITHSHLQSQQPSQKIQHVIESLIISTCIGCTPFTPSQPYLVVRFP
jgi:hypothetical protein